MVFVVNAELAMSAGKIAAQVGHAAVGLYQLMQEQAAGRELICQWDECSSWVIHSPCHYWRRRNGESGDRESEAVELRAATMPNHLCCPGLHAMELASNVYAIWRKKYLLTASQALQ
nr:uncharacterized protein LOC102455608 isoform X1 [Pelodiscus sinensis]|eukprot:XP_025036332.1 uncharacterized protein LOC102455608 isoform X1 [Pelodiscus sinensis]